MSIRRPGPLYWRVPEPLDAYCSKTVRLRFCGMDLSFDLSHGLFSSFDIDAGTRLLLKTVAQRVAFDSLRSALDLGCGVGVLGICVARRAALAAVTLQDRDALAVAVAQRNAQANGCKGLSLDCGLAFWHLPPQPFDLILSNLPAKAGLPVLSHLLRSMRSRLAPGGLAAIVVVDPLAAVVLDTLQQAGCVLDHRESTTSHTVVHFRPGALGPSAGGSADSPEAGPVEDLEPYIRGQAEFRHGGTSYRLQTVYSLPEFDTQDYGTSLAIDILGSFHTAGQVLVWNPGQGHLPVYLAAKKGNAVKAIHLASVDSLELAVTGRNLRWLGIGPASATPLPFEHELQEKFPAGQMDLISAVPHPVPKAGWQRGLSEAAERLLRPGGGLLVAGSSTEIHRYLQQQQGCRLVESRKLYGHRAVLLRKL